MDDEKILSRGGDERDIEEYAKSNGADLHTPNTESEWEERFDNLFRKGTFAVVDGSREAVKDFIRTEITAAEQRKVAEIREAVESYKFELTPVHESVAAGMSLREAQDVRATGTAYNSALDDVLFILQANS